METLDATAQAMGHSIDKLVYDFLLKIGEDPERDGLKGTPSRVTRSWVERTNGYKQDPAEILSKNFEVSHDEMIVVRDIDFYSTCEHHLLPFSGVAHVGYIPKSKVVGLSKLARLIECYAHRLQIQERMTQQIAHSINAVLDVQGVGVIIEAQHLCMQCRGVKKEKAVMVTSCLRGSMKEDPRARAEFLELCRG